MKISIKDAKPGIYVIRNLINKKLYVGKSNNIYKRLYQHVYCIMTEEQNYNENPYLLKSIQKHGLDNFDYYIIEEFDKNLSIKELEKLLSNRELYWMKELNTLDRNFGYNLRYDSEGKCYCSDETKKKISNRLKEEWKSGIRDEHSDKLKDYWKDNNKRKEKQSEVMSRALTKYKYIIYSPEDKLITEEGTYQILKDLGLTNAQVQFKRKNSDEIVCKKHKIIRKLICKDIVHAEEKSTD